MSQDTRPTELAEILDDERKFRLYVIQKLERSTAWQDTHDSKDDSRFREGDARMARIEQNLGGVSSKVETEHNANSYSLKQMVAGALLLCGSIGGAIAFMFNMLSHKP